MLMKKINNIYTPEELYEDILLSKNQEKAQSVGRIMTILKKDDEVLGTFNWSRLATYLGYPLEKVYTPTNKITIEFNNILQACKDTGVYGSHQINVYHNMYKHNSSIISQN